jgi:thymidylate synthase (FAD)
MKVELLESFGNDNMVANCARVSYNKEASDYTESQNGKLLKFLAEHNHWSPFSHPKLQFRLEVPIYVERQLIKTQAGVEYNSVSGRYVDFSDTYTLITEWRKQSTDSKQGSEGLVENQKVCSQIEQEVLEFCQTAYQTLISNGVSKEQARSILPLNLNTTMIWTGSLYAFIRLCKQRLKPDAQFETQIVCNKMLKEVESMPHSPFLESLKVFNLKSLTI